MPSARDQEVLCLLAEWFDPLPQLTKQYLLRYYCDTNEAEMVELKTKRLFLKRSPCPSHFSSKDFALGSKIILYGRDLTIAAFADKPTEDILTPETESAVFLVGPEGFPAVGKILDELVACTHGLLAKLKMARPDPATALEAARCVGLQGAAARDAAAGLCRSRSGGVALGIIRGHNARDLAAKACARFAAQSDAVWCCGSEQQGANLESLFAPGGAVSRGKRGGATATFDSCTCCVIKPHAVKAGNAGKIIDKILNQGFEISAMESFRLTRTQAQEFFEIYQGVIPKYTEVLDEMTTGTCVALEVSRESDTSPQFRPIPPHDAHARRHVSRITVTIESRESFRSLSHRITMTAFSPTFLQTTASCRDHETPRGNAQPPRGPNLPACPNTVNVRRFAMGMSKKFPAQLLVPLRRERGTATYFAP
ncbi:unnamed protein product, partial [Ectocarpus sp. 4 AP-2014]